jgi:DNA-binding Lrp family transcriptional regulator
LLSEEKTLSQYDLAERLHTRPETVLASLDFLHRAGYLRKTCAVNDCGKKCAGCSGCGVPQNGAVLWELMNQVTHKK